MTTISHSVLILGDGGAFDPPKEWIDQGTDNVKVVPLTNTTPEYQSIEKRFTDSVKNGKFAKTSPDVINKKVTVTKVCLLSTKDNDLIKPSPDKQFL